MRPPGGELTFYTALGMLYGIGASIAGFVFALPGYFAFAAVIGLPSLGVWFEQRWAGLFLAAVIALSIPGPKVSRPAIPESGLIELTGSHFVWWQ
ncbi:hypothetical protein NZK35_03945 [Stieleria sp. ICT_E10.1]|uniref:hypothetical protein n=1 Tax=Stieleria sedimenti TaxID=2976331 RepID=UPI0021801957|nr:hypothetical protein [Stieleria sedimenti]MCS7465826.1 hypothetical protein [Stieleria sedimenti]